MISTTFLPIMAADRCGSGPSGFVTLDTPKKGDHASPSASAVAFIFKHSVCPQLSSGMEPNEAEAKAGAV